MNPLYGTGTCFDDAIEIMTEMVKADKALAFDPGLVVVHALGINSAGEPFSHAWVEFRGIAIFRAVQDGQIGCFCSPVEEYHAQWQISKFTRYTVRDVVRENLRSGHFGPWEEIYDKHTRQGKREHESTINGVNGRESESREVEPGAAQRDIQNSGETSMGDKK